jgi:1,4-dihydroxy-2-naphthoyl-CoA hydrolase
VKRRLPAAAGRARRNSHRIRVFKVEFSETSVLKSLTDFQQLIPNTALEPLGVEIVSVDEKGLTLRMPITNATRQPFGLLHGGMSLLLAESAASMHSAWDINPEEVIPVGIEINGSHLRSATSGHVIATARLLRRSQALAVHSVAIIHEETQNQLCECRVTNYYKKIAGPNRGER